MKKNQLWLGLLAFTLLLGLTATAGFADEAEPVVAAAPTPDSAPQVAAAQPAPAATASEQVTCDPATSANAQGSEPAVADLVFLGGGGACSNCGSCNCNGDDECYFICGHVANCAREQCPCTTCKGVCEC